MKVDVERGRTTSFITAIFTPLNARRLDERHLACSGYIPVLGVQRASSIALPKLTSYHLQKCDALSAALTKASHGRSS